METSAQTSLITKHQPFLEENGFLSGEQSERLWDDLVSSNFKNITTEDLRWAKRVSLPIHPPSFRLDAINLWCSIHSYTITSEKEDKQKNLEEIKTQLDKLTERDRQPSGTGLLPSCLSNGTIVKAVYHSSAQEVKNLFSQYSLKPRASLFPKKNIPRCIQEEETANAKLLADFFKKRLEKANKPKTLRSPNEHINDVELNVIKLQRALRGLERKRQMRLLIEAHLKRKYGLEYKTDSLDNLINDANSPYRPNCSPSLQKSLLDAAKKIKLFSTIKHLTWGDAVPSILDNGLKGNKSLRRNFQSFREAALAMIDQENGDSNVICFGAFRIDDSCLYKDNTVRITIDLDKVRKPPQESHNSCIFFKQQDLGYNLRERSTIKINGIPDIYFNHTMSAEGESFNACMRIYSDENGQQVLRLSKIDKFKLISNNFNEMNEILTMNFFRYLDQLKQPSSQETDEKFINSVYSALEKLTDSELETTLSHIARAISNTMEFNFYGAYLMDISSIKQFELFEKFNSQRLASERYVLNIETFIKALNTEGAEDALQELEQRLPQLLQSYRFIDYLLSQVDNQAVQTKLKEHRSKVELPLWRQMVEGKGN